MFRRIHRSSPVFAALLLAFQPLEAATVPVDAVSGASSGRKMVTVSTVDVTANTASIDFSEGFRNGSLRFYYSTTAFTSASDTTRSTVTKVNVGTRGNGSVDLAGLAPATKYYYRFQGYYTKGMGNYWATGSFTTATAAAIGSDRRKALPSAGSTGRDVLGRSGPRATGADLETGEARVRPTPTPR